MDLDDDFFPNFLQKTHHLRIALLVHVTFFQIEL